MRTYLIVRNDEVLVNNLSENDAQILWAHFNNPGKITLPENLKDWQDIKPEGTLTLTKQLATYEKRNDVSIDT